jgi:heme/copper-type cytochrome/quinol oxidase subunit 4
MEGAPAMTERKHDSKASEGVRAMKYFVGFIVGVALTIAGAWLYDNSGAAPNPLVNWTTANDLVRTAVDDVRIQFDRLVKQLGG